MAPGRARTLRALSFGSSKGPVTSGPPSPTFSDATHVSAMNFGANGPEKIITRTHLKASLSAYEDVSLEWPRCPTAGRTTNHYHLCRYSS